jgi:FAD:protein FMN transferase
MHCLIKACPFSPASESFLAEASNRRDFLKGRAALRAARELTSNFGAQETAEGETGSRKSWDTSIEAGYLVSYGRRAMACEWEVLLNYHEQALGTPPALAALDLIEELEAQLSVFRETTEISLLNKLAAKQPVEVEARLFQLLLQAAMIWQETEGAFDITSGPLTKVWGFYLRQGRLPSNDEIHDALSKVGMPHVVLDPNTRTVRFSKPGIELNLGSIGKGYALDRCAELFATANVPNFLLHGGNSSLLARGGQGQGDCWWIGIRDPLRSERRLFEVAVRNRAIGTSGAAVQFFVHRGKRYGHILDPRNGWPANQMLSVTVLAPTAALADALATAFYVLGPAGTRQYVAEHPDVAAMLFIGGEKSGTWDVEALNLAEEDLRSC